MFPISVKMVLNAIIEHQVDKEIPSQCDLVTIIFWTTNIIILLISLFYKESSIAI
jgi:hypothetical protein